MVSGEKQVVKLNMIDIVPFKGSCHHGFPAARMSENKTDVCITGIEAFFLIVKIRLRKNERLVWQLQVFKQTAFCIQFRFYKVVHFRNIMIQELV